MKKLLLAFTAIVIFSFSSYSQCIPDTYTTPPYIRPDSATNLPHAQVGVPYSAVIQVRVPLDTTSGSFTCNYDYIDVLSISGLPTGYSYSCTPSSCHFTGNSNNCVLISGPAPPQAWEGNTFPLNVTIHYRLYLAGFPSVECANAIDSTSLGYYMIIVDQASGIETLSASKFNVAQNKPNPFSRTTTIEFSSPSRDSYTLKVSNILGKVVYSKTISADRGLNKIVLNTRDISFKEFSSGVYFYTLSNNKHAITKRMVIRND
jgi:hypothetical protein